MPTRLVKQSTRRRSRADARLAIDLAPNRRRNILVAAERLFAARGFHGVSIRDIADEAGVPLALVGYYFGPKVELYQQIYRERAGYIQQRLEALKHAQSSASPGQLLDEIVKAFVLPVLTVAASPDGRHFLRLIARGINDQLEEDELVVRELFDPLAHAFIDALKQALPQTSRGTAAWCYQFALGALLLHVTDKRIERLSLGENHLGDEDSAAPVLVRFITEGIRGACGALSH
jgi:AcrR family transcriptional regulator